MPSSKGKPTDPKLREEVKEGMFPFCSSNEIKSLGTHVRRADVKNETNKDGSGKGQMTAWKVWSPLLLAAQPRDLSIKSVSRNFADREHSTLTGSEDGQRIRKERWFV